MFDLSKLFSPDFLQKAASTLDPSIIPTLLSSAQDSGMPTGGLKPAPLETGSMAAMLSPQPRSELGLQVPNGGPPGGQGLAMPQNAANMLPGEWDWMKLANQRSNPGMSPQMLQALGGPQVQQPHFAPAVAPPSGGRLGQMQPFGVPQMPQRQVPSMAQLLYGR